MKFEGDNPFNNRVWVDFKTKKVSFEPVKGSQTIIRIYLMFLFNCIFFMCLLLIIPIILFELLQENTGNIIIISGIISGFIISTLYWDKKWRKIKYPMFSHRLLTIIHKLVTLGLFKDKEKIITSKSLFLGKYFMIPKFQNVILQYELKGDFAKQIKDIRIDNLFKDDPFEWYCIIEFYKKPKNGSMKIIYS